MDQKRSRFRVLLAAPLLGVVAGCPGPRTVGGLPPPFSFMPADAQYLDPRVTGTPVTLEVAPPPISGGTLTVQGTFAVVSDSDRDRVLTVDLVSGTVIGTASLPEGSEPGRVAIDSHGNGHVALRSSGQLYSFDLEHPEEGNRRNVCPVPRGVAFDEGRDAVWVACRGGELMALPSNGGDANLGYRIEGGDLRDVIVRGDELLLTRFRAAELLTVAADTGRVSNRVLPHSSIDSFNGTYDEDGVFHEAEFHPSVAWRTVPISQNRVAMVHQRASDADLQTAPGAYYSTSLCNGSIVQSSVTVFDQSGNPLPSPNLMDASLTVDLAVSPDEQTYAVVNAGNESGVTSVALYDRSAFDSEGALGAVDCLYSPNDQIEAPNAVAAAWSDDDTLVIQQRDPAALTVYSVSRQEVRRITLGGESRFDTGHALFHANAGRSTACASCHPEGTEDGRTWRFADMGARRTPALFGDLTRTAPFHWDGDLPNMEALAKVVFTERMGGPALPPTQVRALGGWLDQLRPPMPSQHSDPEAVSRGRALFLGEAECVSCHSGPMLTDNRNADVGTGGSFQVPSLIGIASRLPVMHTGCANTLRDRFDPGCGGARHGKVDRLSEGQLDDLVAYMETL